MVKKNARSSVLLILLAALSATSQAQDAKTILDNAAKAMGAATLKTLQYSGSGSIYSAGPSGSAPSVHEPVKRYAREIDFQAVSSRLQITRVQGTPPAEQTESQIIGANSPWPVQYDYWITPYGFLKGAMANNATAESRTVLGDRYNVVTFTLQNKYRVSGYINGQNMVEKVQTWLENPAGELPIEASYRDYTDVGGLKFPTTILQKKAGVLSLILIVTDVKPNAAVNIPPAQTGD